MIETLHWAGILRKPSYVVGSLQDKFKTFYPMWSFSTELWLFFSNNSSKMNSWRSNTMNKTFHWAGILPIDIFRKTFL